MRNDSALGVETFARLLHNPQPRPLAELTRHRAFYHQAISALPSCNSRLRVCRSRRHDSSQVARICWPFCFIETRESLRSVKSNPSAVGERKKWYFYEVSPPTTHQREDLRRNSDIFPCISHQTWNVDLSRQIFKRRTCQPSHKVELSCLPSRRLPFTFGFLTCSNRVQWVRKSNSRVAQHISYNYFFDNSVTCEFTVFAYKLINYIRANGAQLSV